MRLTSELVARVARHVADPGPVPGRVYANDADYEAAARALLADRPGERRGVGLRLRLADLEAGLRDRRSSGSRSLRGWHRAFCLGWDRRFRGTDERPGLMLALDRGGNCTGVVQRLPPDAVEANLDRLLRREMLTKPSPFPPRWVSVETAIGTLRAITFAMDQASDAYVTGLSAEEIADVLAAAVGHWGSMAEYLHNTVKHLEELGIVTATFGTCRSWSPRGSRRRRRVVACREPLCLIAGTPQATWADPMLERRHCGSIMSSQRLSRTLDCSRRAAQSRVLALFGRRR